MDFSLARLQAGWLATGKLTEAIEPLEQALLLAPESGEEMRGQIRSRSANFLGEIKSAADVRREQLEKQLAELRAPRLTLKEE